MLISNSLLGKANIRMAKPIERHSKARRIIDTSNDF